MADLRCMRDNAANTPAGQAPAQGWASASTEDVRVCTLSLAQRGHLLLRAPMLRAGVSPSEVAKRVNMGPRVMRVVEHKPPWRCRPIEFASQVLGRGPDAICLVRSCGTTRHDLHSAAVRLPRPTGGWHLPTSPGLGLADEGPSGLQCAGGRGPSQPLRPLSKRASPKVCRGAGPLAPPTAPHFPPMHHGAARAPSRGDTSGPGRLPRLTKVRDVGSAEADEVCAISGRGQAGTPK